MKLNLFPLGPALCALAVASCSAGTADLQDAYIRIHICGRFPELCPLRPQSWNRILRMKTH